MKFLVLLSAIATNIYADTTCTWKENVRCICKTQQVLEDCDDFNILPKVIYIKDTTVVVCDGVKQTAKQCNDDGKWNYTLETGTEVYVDQDAQMSITVE